MTDQVERFWSKVKKGGASECWLWLGARVSRGYGNVWFDRRYKVAHRIAFILTYGEPKGYVCHTCDNPPCCNPAHLFDGSPNDNVRDMIRKGRKVSAKEHLATRGINHWSHRMPEKVRRGEETTRAAVRARWK